jgi:single-stranded-DNA-specific exonuclease
MRIHLSTPQLLQSAQDIEQALLNRIPQEWREHFSQPLPPAQLTAVDLGIDPQQLTEAVSLLQVARSTQQKVLIFGDYDCDGVTATALLWEALREFGITAIPFLPHREKHGYGLSDRVLPDLLASHPDVIITVDNGIVAVDAIATLRDAGITVIISDHHEPGDQLPNAHAIIHSTRLAGVTAAWVLANALVPDQSAQWLDYAALGTIADQVPLVGPSRSFAWHGIQTLRTTTRPSLQALAKIAGLDLTTIDASGVHFGLAPRINAMGRLTDAMEALRALVTRQPDKIAQQMQILQDTNVQRQQLTSDHLQEIAESMAPYSSDRLSIVVGQYHEGIIGLIASKLVDQYYRPSIVITTTPPIAKASCRSVAGIHITEFLRSIDVPYTSLGGHAMAAGFSLAAGDITDFVTKAQQQAQQQISLEVCQPGLEVVGQLAWDCLVPATMSVLAQFSPYGAGNAEPLFQINDLDIIDSKIVGRDGRHRQCTLRDRVSGCTIRSICFDWQRRLGEQWADQHQFVVRLQTSQYRAPQVELQIMAVVPTVG